MNAPGTLLVWLSAAVVALPLSPCAFLISACCQHRQEAKVEVEQPPARSCCAHHNVPAESSSQPERPKPCNRACCRISPFAQTSEKLIDVSQPDALVAMLHSFDDAPSSVITPAASAVLQPLSLNILHCQWRC